MIIKLNLKATALFSFLCLARLGVNAQGGNFLLTIKPDKPLPGYKAFLFYKKSPGNVSIDSVAYTDGKFELKGQVTFQQKAIVYVEPANSNFGRRQNTKPGMTVYLEKGNILLSGKLAYETAKRAGTPLNNDLQAYLDAVRPFAKKEAEFLPRNEAAIKAHDTTAISKLEGDYLVMAKAKRKVEESYFNSHLSSAVSFEWLKTTLNVQQEKSKALQMFHKMSDNLKNSAAGKAYFKSLEGVVSVEVGMPAQDFTAKNLMGEEVPLRSFRGKYVLVDFWASWCIPCRRENPNVLKAYNSYKNQNFTVLAFSFDSSKEAWGKAVKQDNLPWTQVSDLAAFYSPVAGMYGIKSIPSNFLIDPQGKIIARDLRGADLEKTLSRLL